MSYIDREATVKALNRLCDRVCQYTKAQRYAMCGACPLGDAFIVIEDNMPDADVEPIRHGYWILTNKPNIYGGTTVKCSECGYEGLVAHIEDHHYCWVCGAKMEANT